MVLPLPTPAPSPAKTERDRGVHTKIGMQRDSNITNEESCSSAVGEDVHVLLAGIDHGLQLEGGEPGLVYHMGRQLEVKPHLGWVHTRQRTGKGTGVSYSEPGNDLKLQSFKIPGTKSRSINIISSLTNLKQSRYVSNSNINQKARTLVIMWSDYLL